MAEKLGDILWDLAPVLVYIAGVEIHARVLVANPTEADREYMLMVRLLQDTQPVSEGAVKVNGGAWFSVMAGDVGIIEGMMRAEFTDVTMAMELYERESGEVVDSVSAALVSPQTAGITITIPGMPPAQPDYMSQMMPMLMLMLIGAMIGGAGGGGAG